ncbi:MAG: PIN domain-containing protein [Sphingobium sp.]|nr:PIN domain-containing protein [Sphingobium sp.]
MALLLDTSIVIPLRDGDADVWARAAALDTAPYISILTAAELEGGVHRDPANADARRAALNALAGTLDILPFDQAELAAYGAILTATGFNRQRVVDRLIAATALANGLALATRNPRDFRDIPGLEVEEW